MSESAERPGESASEPTLPEQPEAEAAEGGGGLLAELLERGRADAPAAEASGEASLPQPRTRVGKLVGWSSGQAPRVDFEGNEAGPLPARSIIPLDPTTILEAIADERGVLLTFEDHKPRSPIITGLLQPIHELEEEPPEMWMDAEGEAGEVAETGEAGEATLSGVDARVDGRRVEIEAADEIVLRCGKASIVLRRNGRVVIRGTYVETRSRGVNRVKGSTVEIN